MGEKLITVRLTTEQARLVFLNADGWIDAGAQGGMNDDEHEALDILCDQIMRGLRRVAPDNPLGARRSESTA